MTPAKQTGIWLAVALAAVLFLALFQDILLPFVAGIAIAYFLDPLVDRLERRGVGRTVGALLVLAGFAVASFGVLLLMVLTNQAADITSGVAAQVLEGFSLSGHFDDFARGILDTNNVVYYLSVMAVFLFLTIRNIESRRWR